MCPLTLSLQFGSRIYLQINSIHLAPGGKSLGHKSHIGSLKYHGNTPCARMITFIYEYCQFLAKSNSTTDSENKKKYLKGNTFPRILAYKNPRNSFLGKSPARP